MKRAVGYVRRSKESDERTISLTEQESAIREYAKAQGFNLRHLCIDDGVSGRDASRYPPLLESIKLHEAEILIIYHQDRLHRKAKHGLAFLEELEDLGVELWICGFGKAELKTSGGYLQYAFGGVIAEYHAVLCSEKTVAGLRRKRLLGLKYSGVDPYGYHTVEGRLVENRSEQRTIERMKRLRARGASLRVIARFLSSLGSYNRGGRPFGSSMVKKILDREGA